MANKTKRKVILLTLSNVDQYFLEEKVTFDGQRKVTSYDAARKILKVLDKKFNLHLHTGLNDTMISNGLKTELWFGTNSCGELISFGIKECYEDDVRLKDLE